MPRFEFNALTSEGRTITGAMEATDEETALRLLSEKYELVTDLHVLRGRRGGLFGWRFTSEDLFAFTEQLAEMLEGGIAFTGALEILLQDVENPVRHALVSDLLATLNAGSPLSEGLKHHPKVFPPLYRAMVQAGEASGKLPLMLSRLATHLERTEALKRQLRSSLVYPAVVLVFALLVVSFLLIFGVPRLSEMYASMGAQLPLATRLLVDGATFVFNWWYLFAALIAGLGWAAVKFLRGPRGALFVQAVGARIFGQLMSNVAMARFTRTLATLYGSAIPIEEALEMSGAVLGNPLLEAEVLEVRKRVLNGEPLATSLRRSVKFPALVVGMVASGQESGTLDRMLLRLADIYESKVDSGLRSVVALLEPLVIIVVGLLVAGTLVILGLPFLNLGALINS